MDRSVDGGDHPAGVGAVEREMPSLWRTIFKNLLAVGVAGCIWLALQTGYISPDRPTRPQWERIEHVKSKSGGHVVYQSDFRHDLPKADTGTRPAWGRYNGATTEHVSFDPDGVTIHYSGIAWIGARLSFPNYEPGSIYRLSIEATADTEPGAILVRNRQLDLVRTSVPVGPGTVQAHFVAPQGRLDQVVIAFIADSRSAPKGSMRVTSVTIERMDETASAARTE